jgi:elongation factor 1-beta
MPIKFENLETPKGLEELNKYLMDKSYLDGYTPSLTDVETFHALKGNIPDENKYVHAFRWYTHINSFSEQERNSWTSSNSSSSSSSENQKDSKKEDFDLFGDDAEDEAWEAEIERRAAEAKAKKEASGKKKETLKSAIIIDVKPWDSETDMKALEEAVRAIQIEGLEWKASKLVEIGYGIKKLQISCHVVDDIVSVDDVQDQIQQLEDMVQSTDIVSFTKL